MYRDFSCKTKFCFKKSLFIWNKQTKRSLPACGAAVKLHFIVPWRAVEKPPDRSSLSGPLDRKGGGVAPEFNFRSSADEFALSLPYFRYHMYYYLRDSIYLK